MKITIKNLSNGNEINFLDQEQIFFEYGNDKVTLDLADFVNNQDLNLYGTGGNGGLFGLPDKNEEAMEPPFSQEYNLDNDKYSQRTIDLTSFIPANLLTRSSSLYNYLNDTLSTFGTYLTMIIDKTLEGGSKTLVESVTCASSPLTNESYEFSFTIWGDSLYTFKSFPKVFKLTLKDPTNELKYPKEYPIYYESKKGLSEVLIYNGFPFRIPLKIIFVGGASDDAKIEQINTGKFSLYNDLIVVGDKIKINTESKSVLKNNNNALDKFEGDFLYLETGENHFKFTSTNANPTTPPIAYISYQERSTSA